jgi:polyhydroxyalkanoate synthesis regulator phasin
MCARKGNLAKLNYMEIKQLIDRKVIENKKGTLTQGEIRQLVKDLHDQRQEDKLEQGTADKEMEAMQRKIQHYNVEQLGGIPPERDNGAMRILVCQMGGWASAKTRDIKVAATERLIKKYDINLCLFMELNYNWSKVNSSANLASWFTDKQRKTRCIMAHNIEENDALFGKHQPGGTGMLCRSEYLQYARRPTVDPRGLG